MSTLLALDIGTEFVKAVIAKSGKKGQLEVIGVGKARQDLSNMHAGAIADIPGVVSVCEKALSDAEDEAGETAKLAVVGMAGELVKGNTTTVKYHRENGNRPITEEEMNEIINKVQQKSGEITKKNIVLETGNENTEIRLINSAIISLSIDGYPVSNPIGFKGSELSIQFYTAFAPLIHIAAIEKVCAELNLELLAIAVEPFAICRACLGDNLESKFSSIVIDIGGGTTDIAIIDDGGIAGTKMFSIGGRNFTKQIASALDVDYETAENYKLDLEHADLDDHSKEKVKKIIDKNVDVWLSGIKVVIDDFNLETSLPKTILLCGGGSGLSALQEALAVSDWYQDLPFNRRPIIYLVDIKDLPDLTFKNKDQLDYSYMTALGLLRVGLDTAASVPSSEGLKAKLSRLLQK